MKKVIKKQIQILKKKIGRKKQKSEENGAVVERNLFTIF